MQSKASLAGSIRFGLRARVLLVACAAAAVLVGAACGGGDNGNGAEGRVRVTALVPSGGDPHTYEPVPAQVADVTKADLVLVNGLGLEETLKNTIENNVGAGVPVVELSEGLTPVDGEEHEEEGEDAHAHAEGNPHFWLNVRYSMHYVERIRDALIQVDPGGEEAYRDGAARYLAELEALDVQVADAVETIPPERRKLVTFHDAFPYFAQRYGLEVVGFVIRSPGREPSAGEVADLVEKIRGEDVPAVFKEPQLQARVLELAAEEADVEVCTLYSGALDEEVDTYVKLMQHNADELVRCLGQ
jgi:zinc/manganese transport system substrate-binding protein/manganese/iron transport system substrate-binding protein